MKRLLIVACLPLLFGCQRDAVAPPVQAADRPPTPSAAQVREDEFRWKEQCAVAAERFDKQYADPGSKRPKKYELSVSDAFELPNKMTSLTEAA